VVATTLRSLGVDAAARIPARRTAGDSFTDEPDVFTPGLGVHLKAAPIPWERVANYLSRAAQEADERGAGDVPVLVRPAPAAASEDAYVILRLADFARLAQDAAKGRER
jgi:hypothetical protein